MSTYIIKVIISFFLVVPSAIIVFIGCGYQSSSCEGRLEPPVVKSQRAEQSRGELTSQLPPPPATT